jgi:hypothetical protein
VNLTRALGSRGRDKGQHEGCRARVRTFLLTDIYHLTDTRVRMGLSFRVQVGVQVGSARLRRRSTLAVPPKKN